MTAANALAWFAQIGLVVAACAGVPRLIGLRSAVVQHVFWRTVLTVCLLLPLVEPRQPHEMVFVPAPAGAVAPPGAATPVTHPASAAAPIDWFALVSYALAAGAAARLAWIAIGLLRLRRLRNGGVEPATGFDDLRQDIGVDAVSILWSPDTPHPITFGARRPVVLLPMAIKSVDRAAQRAVVAHELHHVKRGDWTWTVGEEVVRAIFWFHPAMWWLISRVQLARETVVDELSILTTNARRAYLDTLLAFADDNGLQSSTAFSARRHLFHRVMLLSKEGTMSSTRVAVSACVLALVLAGGAWKAVIAFPLRGGDAVDQAAPPPPLPRDPQSSESYHLRALMVWEQLQQDLTLTADQRLELIAKAVADEDRALAINPQYLSALAYKNIFLRLQANLTAEPIERDRLVREADALRAEAIKLQKLGIRDQPQTTVFGPNGTPPPPPPPPPPGPIDYSGMPPAFARHAQELKAINLGPTPPMKLKDVRPVYPPIARAANVHGTVALQILIDAGGAVADAHIVKSIPLLDQAALDAVRQWEYRPVTLNGAPAATLVTVTISFNPQ